MADTYKVLYRSDLPSVAGSLYTPGTGKMAIIKSIALNNHGANTETIQLFVNGSAAANEWGPQIKLAPTNTDGSAAEWDGTLALANTDAIFAVSTDATAVAIIITGDEVG